MSREFRYQEQGWDIGIRLFRKKINLQRTLGFITDQPKPVDNFKHLFAALNDKLPGKYNVNKVPYLICLGVDDLSANEYEFSEVLFGQFHNKTLILSDKIKSFFYAKGKPINTKVSGVIFCKSLKIFGLAYTEISFWHNPFAKSPVPHGLLPFEEVFFNVDGNKLVRTRISAPKSVLDLFSIDKQEYLETFAMDYRLPPKAPQPSF